MKWGHINSELRLTHPFFFAIQNLYKAKNVGNKNCCHSHYSFRIFKMVGYILIVTARMEAEKNVSRISTEIITTNLTDHKHR